MTTVDELRKMAHDLYARARASRDPFTKQKLRKSADDHVKDADAAQPKYPSGFSKKQ
jgi:hypothetical protein